MSLSKCHPKKPNLAKCHPKKNARDDVISRKIDLASKAIESLYLNSKKADVYFVCGDQKERIPAHKLILSTANNHFDKIFDEIPAENGKIEIELPKISPQACKEFLQFFYLTDVCFHNEHTTEIIYLAEKYRLSDRLLYDMQIPAAEGSTRHILNVLNDDCIQAILRKLPNINDYLNAVEVCSRFRYNAGGGLPSSLKKLRILDDSSGIERNDRTDLTLPK